MPHIPNILNTYINTIKYIYKRIIYDLIRDISRLHQVQLGGVSISYPEWCKVLLNIPEL